MEYEYSKADSGARFWGTWLLLIAMSCGIVGETLLLLRSQFHQVRAMLSEDFRVVAFLRTDLTESKEKIVEEKIRALAGVADVRFVSRDGALEELKTQDPELVQSIALLGENPLPAAFEIRLEPEAIAGMPFWTAAASKLPEISDLRFKPLEIDAILQLEFYSRFVDVALSLAAAVWLLAAVTGLWFLSRRKEHGFLWREAGVRVSAAVLGMGIGMAAVYAIAYPLKSTVRLWMWPAWQEQLLLAAVGALGACFWPEERFLSKRLEKRHTVANADLAEVEDLAAGTES